MASGENATIATEVDLDSDEWEHVEDDGFVYRRKRRRLDPAARAPDPAPDPGEEKRRKRDRKRCALLKLRERYEKQLALCEHLTGKVKTMEQSANEKLEERHKRVPELAAENGGDEMAAYGGGNFSGLDETVLKVEAQEAMMHNFMNLCDIAEALCDALEEKEKQSFLNLPVWGFPGDLLSSLCEEE